MVSTLKAQDTTLLTQNYMGGYSIRVTTKTDTTEYGYYTKDKTEYIIKRDLSTKNLKYIRYYRNGSKMWEKDWDGSNENGRCIYYNTKGSKVAEFKYASGTIIDTIFTAPNLHLIIGKLSYSSTVYGGMENEDGTSNVSTSTGPYSGVHMKFIQLNPPKGKLGEEYYFTSDFQGEFIVILKPGKYGLFEKNKNPKEISENMFSPQSKPSGSVIENWNMNGPVIIEKNTLIRYFNVHHESVGYAP